MAVFATRTIEELTERLIDYRGKTPPKSESGVRLITAKVIKDGFIQEERAEYISEETYTSWMRRGYPKQSDIVLTTEAPLGEVAQLRKTERIALAQRVILLRGNPNVIDQQFFFQAIKSPFVQAGLQQRATGTTVLGIKQSELRQVNIPYYPLSTQRKIAAILSAYDDLIENNLRRIKILEEMAQNFYREWFVKFRFPGHQHARFTDSPLGRIPEGWLGLFPDFVDFKEGPGLRKWQYRSEGLPFLNIRTLVDNDIDLSKVQHLDPKEVEAKYQHFLLEEYDHVVSSSGTLGRIVTIQKQHLPLMLNTSIIRMRPSTARVGMWQLKRFLNSDYFQHQILSFAIGAAQPNFGPSHLQQMLIVSPSDEIGTLYEETVEPLEEIIGTLVRKNTSLRRTRDLLLPRLISGEVDVSELDITVPEEDRKT